MMCGRVRELRRDGSCSGSDWMHGESHTRMIEKASSYDQSLWVTACGSTDSADRTPHRGPASRCAMRFASSTRPNQRGESAGGSGAIDDRPWGQEQARVLNGPFTERAKGEVQ